MSKLTVERAVLVYQVGIANVFHVTCFNLSDYGRDARRIMQADFRTCEAYAMGLRAAGTKVCTLACNMAGDIATRTWSTDLDAAPFSANFRPVFSKGVHNTDNRRYELEETNGTL
jgi:hypothetical protein